MEDNFLVFICVLLHVPRISGGFVHLYGEYPLRATLSCPSVHLRRCPVAPPPHMGIPPYKGHPTPRTHGLQLFVFRVCIRVIFFAWETMLLCFLLTYVNKEKKKFQEPEECITLESNFHWIKGSFQGLVPVQPMMLAHLIVLEYKTIESPLMNALVTICCDRGNVSH